MWEIRREIRLKDRIYIGNKKGIYGLRAGNPRVGFSPTPSPVPMISQKKSVNSGKMSVLMVGLLCLLRSAAGGAEAVC